MSYSVNLKKSMDEYQKLLNEYKEIVESERYAEIVRVMPFEFVSGLNICNLLTSFNNDDIHSRMQFQSAQDATAIYTRIIDFRNKDKELLESADFIMQAKLKADEINELVTENYYLPSHLKIKSDTYVESLAKECLEQIPHYQGLMTKKFRNRFTESCIESLPNEELDKLVMNHLIKTEHLDMISPIGTKEYEDHLSHLCHVLNHNEIIVASYKQTLKGTSFDNEDGTKRQDILKDLEEAVKQNKSIKLAAEQYLYVPEVGKEEPAIRISWNGKTIGNIAKDVVFDILSKYKNPEFKVDLKEITGGNHTVESLNSAKPAQNIYYGCNVDLKVYSMVPQKTDQNIVENKEFEK